MEKKQLFLIHLWVSGKEDNWITVKVYMWKSILVIYNFILYKPKMVLFNLVTQFIYKHWFILHWALKKYNNVSDLFSQEKDLPTGGLL